MHSCFLNKTFRLLRNTYVIRVCRKILTRHLFPNYVALKATLGPLTCDFPQLSTLKSQKSMTKKGRL